MSLSTTPQGTTVRVRLVLFDQIRDHCLEHGCGEGTVIRVAEQTPTHLLLDLADGRKAHLEHDLARFIEVEQLGDR